MIAPAITRASMTPPAPDPEALVRRHQTGLWRYLRSLGAPAELAEDLLQDTFLIALRKLEHDHGHGATAAYLQQTARHLYLRRRRDQGRREQILVELADRLWRQDCGEDCGEAWLAALRACLELLEGRARQAVQLFYGEGQDRLATAAALGMKPNGLKTLLQRLRSSLRTCIGRRIGEMT